jgi:magnesium chelatase family protein
VRPTRTAPAARVQGDLADVLGQERPRAALEVAAAGGHHLLLVGPPGAGKTTRASRLPGILPDLTDREAVEVTAVHSVAGTFDPGGGLTRQPRSRTRTTRPRRRDAGGVRCEPAVPRDVAGGLVVRAS